MNALGIIFSNIHDKNINELTANRTLASVPFGGRFRLVDFVLSNMVNSGIIKKVGIVTKSNYQSLMDHVGSGKYWDLNRKNGGLMFLPPFGVETGGTLYTSRFEALKNIVHFLRRSDETYVVMSDCDTVCSMDFSKVVARHIEKHADITVVYRKCPRAEKDITFSFEKDGRVSEVKLSAKDGADSNVYANIVVMHREFLLALIDNAGETGYKSFSGDVLRRGCTEYKIYGYELESYYARIDSLAGYYKHSMDLLDKKTRDMLFYADGASVYTKVRDSAPCRFENDAVVKNSLVADGCIIEGEVTNSILFRGVKVGKGAVIKNSIVFQDSVISAGSKINCVIADKQVKILEERELSGHETHPYFIAKNSVI